MSSVTVLVKSVALLAIDQLSLSGTTSTCMIACQTPNMYMYKAFQMFKTLLMLLPIKARRLSDIYNIIN
jgi:hypothetical protein